MKKISLLTFITFLSFQSFSQNYTCGACFVGGLFVKMKCKIIINDSIVEISNVYKDVEKKYTYNILKKTNDNIYISDGIFTHTLLFSENSGTKKGFEYDINIIIYYDKNSPMGGVPQTSVIYYCKKTD